MTMRLALPPIAIPPRQRGVELLDDPLVDPAIALRSLRDVALSNRLFGGVSAVLAELRPLFRDARARGATLSLLDVGTGLGDIPARASREAARYFHSAAILSEPQRVAGVDDALAPAVLACAARRGVGAHDGPDIVRRLREAVDEVMGFKS